MKFKLLETLVYYSHFVSIYHREINNMSQPANSQQFIKGLPPSDKLCSEQQRTEELKKICNAADKYTNTLRSICISTIVNAGNRCSSKIPVNLDAYIRQYQIDGIPIHILHYGYQIGEWTNREQLECDDPFTVIQRELSTKGYYLIEETNPKQSQYIHIYIYCENPTNNNKQNKLWHNHNVILPAYKNDKTILAIISAKELLNKITENIQTKNMKKKIILNGENNNTNNQKQLDRLELATNTYKKILMGLCMFALNTHPNDNKVLVDINEVIHDGRLNNIPVHILHYGHYEQEHDSKWTDRKPLEIEPAFRIVQQELAKKGIYLIEESDITRNQEIEIYIYNGKPTKSTYFNKIGKLWHNHNVIPGFF